jgi:hypothetical protein
MGHSGAPSPFAISIVSKGETKWNLCFDHHHQQMEWLAAISDIVIQNSVDAYNRQLVDFADPSNTIIDGHTNVFRAPPQQPTNLDTTSSKAAVDSGGAVAGQCTNRLWMLDAYELSSRKWSSFEQRNERTNNNAMDAATTIDLNEDTDVVSIDNAEYDENAEGDNIIVEQRETLVADVAMEELDHSAAQQYAAGTASKTLVVPETNIWYVVITLNVSLALARASSTTIEGFWYLVVISNILLLFSVIKQPDWRSVLEYVRAEPKTSTLSQESVTVLTKDSTGGHVSMTKMVSTTGLRSVKRTVETQQRSLDIPAACTAIPTSPKKANSGYIPVAGSSSVRLKHEKDPPVNTKNEMFAGWRSLHAFSWIFD